MAELPERQQRKMLRETLRLKRTTTTRIANRPGPPSLRQVSRRYAALQLHRCKSDAEAYAVELIDGEQFHRDRREDARKTAIWQAAGWRVRRAESDLVFSASGRFVAGVRHHLAH